MAKQKRRIYCKFCDYFCYTPEDFVSHLEKHHDEMIPEDMTPWQFSYYLRTGKTHGNCIVCKKETSWNEKTHKYNRFCNNPKCKEKYRELFKNRMIGKYGKTHLLNDPEQQKKMLANRKISGEYIWRDNVTKTTYTGSYEKSFLVFLDEIMNFDPSDIMAPSPHTYFYVYEGEKHFYIPDFFIPSLNLEIEIKDGGDNANQHPKIQAVDKVKEKLKDEVMMKNQFNYIKITNQNNEKFFEFLNQAKYQFSEKDEKPIYMTEKEMTLDDLNKLYTEKIKDEDIFEKILEFNGVTNNMGYILPNGGNIITHIDHKDYTDSVIEESCKSLREARELSQKVRELAKKYDANFYFVTDGASTTSNNGNPAVKVARDAVAEWERKNGFDDKEDWSDNPDDFSNYKLKKGSGDLINNESFIITSKNDEYTIQESLMFNGKDIYYNKDKFDSGEINLCFITGHSGSGKSTIGREMQTNNIEHYDLDDLQCIKDHFTMNDLKKYGDLIYSYFAGPGKKFYLTYDEIIEKNLPGSEYEDIMYKEFVHYSMKYAKLHKDKKYVIEGVWLFGTGEDKKPWFSPEEFKDYAFYIKGTSMLISKYRGAKRDAKADSNNKKEERKAFRNNFFKKNWKWYFLDEKRINVFRNYFSTKVINENAYLIYESDQKSSIDNNFEKKSSDSINSKTIDIHSNEANSYINNDKYLSSIKSKLKNYNGEIIVDTDKEKIIGRVLLGTGKDEGFIGALRVNDDYKGYGFGSQLIDDAVKKYNGIDLIVYKDNKVAQKIYKDHGFVIIGDSGSKDSYWMKLKSKLTEDDKIVNESVIAESSDIISKINHNIKLAELKSIASRIKSKVDRYRKQPTGNQNCMICTWCTEAQIRGINILPRPVYSPRDVIFSKDGYSIVINPIKIKFENKDILKDKLYKAGSGSRYYAHINWKDSEGGHEFILINIDNKIFVVDSQEGLVEEIDSSKGSYYFKDINYNNSYIVRMDNKEFNKDILKYNDMKYLTEWDDEKDTAYLMSKDKNISESVDDLYEETHWDTLLTRPEIYLNKKVKLYHLSNTKKDIVIPITVNAGNKLAKPRFSSWWTWQKSQCGWGLSNVIFSKFPECKWNEVTWTISEFNQDGKIYKAPQTIIGQSFFDNHEDFIKSIDVYIHEKVFNGHDLGRGNEYSVDEFTCDFAVKPDSVKRVDWNEMLKYIKIVPDEDLAKYKKELNDMRLKNKNFQDMVHNKKPWIYWEFEVGNDIRAKYCKDHNIDFKVDEEYYRFTYRGIGVYEALRQHVDLDTWKKLLNSSNFTWLPKPDNYPKSNLSYFTRDGRDLFIRRVLPICEKYLGDDIEFSKVKNLKNIVYKDKYQIIIDIDKEGK